MLHYFFTVIFFFVSFDSVLAACDYSTCSYSEGVPCDFSSFGHRRCLLQRPAITITMTETPNKEYDFSDHFQILSEKSEILRSELIKNNHFGHKQSEINEARESKKDVNVVAFGFVVFNENGDVFKESDNEDMKVFYFRPDSEQESIYLPFFFLAEDVTLSMKFQTNGLRCLRAQ